MAKKLKVTSNGEWTTLHIEGNPKNPEAAHAGQIKFPGGEVNVTRTTTGEYWVHINVDRPGTGFFIDGETQPARVVDARVDNLEAGKHLKDVGYLNDENTTHFAVKIKKDVQ